MTLPRNSHSSPKNTTIPPHKAMTEQVAHGCFAAHPYKPISTPKPAAVGTTQMTHDIQGDTTATTPGHRQTR
jgi:hypothetical protein